MCEFSNRDDEVTLYLVEFGACSMSSEQSPSALAGR